MTRKEAVNILENDLTGFVEGTPIFMDAFWMAVDALKQEPKTGHWKRIGKRGEYAYICSQCNHESIYNGNFCPNCGADMKDGEA